MTRSPVAACAEIHLPYDIHGDVDVGLVCYIPTARCDIPSPVEMVSLALRKVSDMMEHARPVQALRYTRLRDRAIASLARKENVRREPNIHQNGTKRGRVHRAAHSPLGESFSSA